MRSEPRRRFATAGVLCVLVVLLVSCDSASDLFSVPVDASGFAVAYGKWEPGPFDTCTKAQHDAYSVVGPDGLLYPTWHPAVDPSGCTFGHEHGRDPRGSDLFGEVGPIPFGLANTALDTWDPQGRRHEDHVGHKIEWENDIELSIGGGAAALLTVRCDVLTKLHQGSHSKDAFTNNVHELVYHLRCTDGAGFSTTFLAAIGTPGEFVASCDRSRTIVVGTATPPSSPPGGGKRAIPDRVCVERHMLRADGSRSDFNAALRESWEVSGKIRRADGRTLVSFNPYFQVMAPSRFFDPAAPDFTGRPIDVCYEVTSDGRRASGGLCESSTGNGAIPGVTFDHPASDFKGVRRFVDINQNRVTNAEGPAVWYSDPFGKNARVEPFPGAVRQWIAVADNSAFDTHGPVIGKNRNHGDRSVHAPN